MKIYPLNLDIADLVDRVMHDWPGPKLCVDGVIRSYPDTVMDIYARDKILITEFMPDYVRIPHVENGEVPWEMVFYNSDHRMDIGNLVLGGLFIAKAKNFPDEIARLGGYWDTKDMIRDLESIYHVKVPSDHPISGYLITGIEG